MGQYTLGGLSVSAYMMWIGIQIYQFPIVQVKALSGFPLQTRLFPAAQFGQFGSANAMGKAALAIFATMAAAQFVEFVTGKFGNFGIAFVYLWSGMFGLLHFVAACVLFRYWHLFGGAKFSLDLSKGTEGSGVSRAALWRPLQIGAVAGAVVMALGLWGLVILANRPNLGYVPDQNNDLTNAKTLEALRKKVEGERAGFSARHAENLKTLSKKHLFYRHDTVLEARHYAEAAVELERAAREAQVTLAGRVLKKAEVQWCLSGQMAVDYYLKDPVTAEGGVVLAVDKVEEAVKALEGAGFKVEKGEPLLKVTGHNGLGMWLATDGTSRRLPAGARKGNVPGTSLKGMQMAADNEVFAWKVMLWRDAGRGEAERRKDWSDIRRLIKAKPSLRKHLPMELRKEFR
jgi:hypothetical protein